MEALSFDQFNPTDLLSQLSAEHAALWQDCIAEKWGGGKPRAIALHDALHAWLDDANETPLLQLFEQLPSKVHLPPIAILLAALLTRKSGEPVVALSHPSCPERGWGPPPALLRDACTRLQSYGGRIAEPTPVITRFATKGQGSGTRLLMATCITGTELPREVLGKLDFRQTGDGWDQPDWLPSPDHVDTIDFLGLLPTMVGPFPYRCEHVDTVYLRPPPQHKSWICLRCTPTDTLLVPRDIFEQTLTSWCLWQRGEPPNIITLPT